MPGPDAFCPYVGLQPYTEADRDYFFGRERDQRIIVSNLYAAALTVLYGASGAGKSSVLLAGVVPRLRAAPRTAVVVFREWQGASFLNTLKSCCLEAVAAAQQKPLAEGAVDLMLPFDDLLCAAAEAFGGSILILFDQFEEYFLYHPESETSNTFDSEFARAINRDEVDASFLIALREDGLSKLDRFRARIPNLLGNTLRLQHMDATAAEEAIRKPLEVYNARFSVSAPPITIEDALVHAILAQVRTGQVLLSQSAGTGQAQTRDEAVQIEAPFLQLVMTRLWDEEMQANSRVLRLSTLERLGGAEEIVHTHLDGVMTKLEPTEQEVCSRFFDRLVTPTGSKIACNVDDLTNWAGNLAVQVPSVLKTLSDNRILRSVAAPADQQTRPRSEIFHDVLAPAILDWRARYVQAQERAETERQAAEQQRQAEGQARAEAQLRAAGRLRRLSVALVVMVICAVGAALWALQQGRQAERAREEAEKQRSRAEQQTHLATSRYLVSQSLQRLEQNLDQNFALSLLLGLEAYQRNNETLGSLITGLKRKPHLTTFLRGHGGIVNGVAFSPDGNMLASGSLDQTLRLWEVATRKLLDPPLIGHTKGVLGVAFSPDGKLLASGSMDKTIILWDIATHQPLSTLTGHTDTVWSVAFSPDGKTLASGSKDQTIRLWDVATRRPFDPPLTGHTNTVESVAFSPDGKTLASGSADNTIRLWDVAARQFLAPPLMGHTKGVTSVAFSPDYKTLTSGSKDQTIRLWDVATRQPLASPLTGHRDRVTYVAFSPDGKTLVSSSDDQTIILWNVATHQPLSALTGHTDPVENVAFSPDGKTLASSSDDQTIILWNVADNPPLDLPLTGHTDRVSSMAFSPDGKTLASGSEDKSIILWDIATHQPLSTLTGHTDTVWSVAFSPDSKTLASGSDDNTIRLWDVATRRPLDPPLTGHTNAVESVAFSPDGKTLASGSCGSSGVSRAIRPVCQQGEIRLWDVATRRPLDPPLTGHTNTVKSVAFSPDSKTLASGSDDNTIRLWDVATRQPLASPLTGHTGRVTYVAFSLDGKTLVSGSADNTIILWDIATHKSLGTLTGHTDRVSSMAFSPDGKTLASGSANNTIIVWDVAARQQLDLPLTGHTDWVSSVAFSPDGKTLASGSVDNTIILWDFSRAINLEPWQARVCRVTNRNLTRAEWKEYIGDIEPYRATCPDLPIEGEVNTTASDVRTEPPSSSTTASHP